MKVDLAVVENPAKWLILDYTIEFLSLYIKIND